MPMPCSHAVCKSDGLSRHGSEGLKKPTGPAVAAGLPCKPFIRTSRKCRWPVLQQIMYPGKTAR
eukprot:745781-Amphidinium_carterae.1